MKKLRSEKLWADFSFPKKRRGATVVVYTLFPLNPDPPILAFLEKKKKQGLLPKKARVFLFAEPLKSLEKKGKTHKKQGKSENEKSKEIEKKKGKEEGQGIDYA